MGETNKTCGYCALFRKEDGYCRKKGVYVNAMTFADCFSDAAMILKEMKVCADCGRNLPLEEFGTVNGRPKKICRSCQGKRIQEKRGKKQKPAPDEPKVTVKPEAKERRQAERDLKANYTDEQMVALLREHGWTVTCTRTITEEL